MNINIGAIYAFLTSKLGKVWGWTAFAFLMLIFFTFIGWIFNVIGCKLEDWSGYGEGLRAINFLFFLFSIISGVLLFISPDVITPILTAAVVFGEAQPTKIKAELENFFKIYSNFAAWVLLVFSLVFLFLTRVPIRENIYSFPLLVGLSVALILAFHCFKMPGKWGQRIIIFLLVVSIFSVSASLIPNTVYKKTIGFAPSEVFGLSETEKSLQKLDEVVAEKADNKKAARIDELLEKIEDGQVLSKEEQAELSQLRKETEKKSLPARFGNVIGQVLSSIEVWWKSDSAEASVAKIDLSKATLVKEVVLLRPGKNATAFGKILDPGEYFIIPADSRGKKTRMRFCFSPGNFQDRSLFQGRFFSIEKGDQVSSVYSDYAVVRIYKKKKI